MTSPVEALYRQVVLEHYRHPRNRTPLDDPDARAKADNPLCGDQSVVEVKLRDGRIDELSARTRGCSIAVAAGSVMTERVADLAPAEARKLHRALEALLEGRGGESDTLDPSLRAFERVAELPSRRRCALLPWEALEQALAEAAGDPPTEPSR